MSIENDPKPGRPRTSTDLRSLKLVADALEENHRATCEELPRAGGTHPAAREGYFTKYNALRISKLEALDHGCAKVAHCVTAR